MAFADLQLATSTHKRNYELKTGHLQDTFKLFHRARVLGDDERIPHGRGKPHPDIYLLALSLLNESLGSDIKPEECLVFEDGIIGVESARAAGMQVIWIPDEAVHKMYLDEEEKIVGDWGGVFTSLENVPLGDYKLPRMD